jgi:transposase
MMQRTLRPSALVPDGFEVESAVCDGATTMITVRPKSGKSNCPGCGGGSERIHSRYQRRLADLPLAGRSVGLVVVARRFRCDPLRAAAASLPNALIAALWRRGRGERHDSTLSFIILALHWVAGPRRILHAD